MHQWAEALLAREFSNGFVVPTVDHKTLPGAFESVIS
jgi:hypothetical protein